MFDPLTLLMFGAGAVIFREMNRKDYGVFTPERDERYRSVMERCMEPSIILKEAQLFDEYGLKAQAKMLKRRAEWRARPIEVKQAHEEVYQKAIKSTNIAGILEVAAAFEGWTATKKASNLRERAQSLQEAVIAEVAKKVSEASEVEESPKNGKSQVSPESFVGIIEPQGITVDDV